MTRTLGDYTLVKKLGQGSLGTVYLAEHRFMKKPFALKVLPEDLAGDRQFTQRFDEEVGRLCMLEHPHIVKIHDVSSAQGSYYVVMDCVVDEINETTNLAQFISTRKERFEEQEILSMLRQIADALDYAHGKTSGDGAVVHRGLKLSNVLVGKKNQLYLSDFGLSKVIGSQAVLKSTFSGVAESLGSKDRVQNAFLQSFMFLAPEQKWGGEVDAKADVYAFGVLAYYLLTREFPEGLFPMPSEIAPDYRLNWDVLIRACLQQSAFERPSCLLDALDEVEEAVTVKVAAPRIQPVKVVPAPAPKPVVREVRPAPTPVTFKTVTPERLEGTLARKIEEQAPVKVAVTTAPSEVKPATKSPYPLRNEPAVTPYMPEQAEAKDIEPIPSEMVVIEGGTFWRGSNDGSRDEMPRHRVHLAGFAMDIHPVTNEQFALFLEHLGEEKDSSNHDLILFRESRIHRSSGRVVIESGYGKHPVVGITWYGALAYANWVGKRLPTEVEWETAARGGNDEALYPTGERLEKSGANFFSSDTTPVMSYPANPYGLSDMAGNVYEWCQDWYGYNSYDTSMQEPDQPTGPIQGVYRVMRGGCWKSLQEDLRCSHRHRNNPGAVNGTSGFRCASST